MKKYIVEAYDSKEEKWYVSSVHTDPRKARRAKEDLEFSWHQARIKEEG